MLKVEKLLKAKKWSEASAATEKASASDVSNYRDKSDNTLLHWATHQGAPVDLITKLLDKGIPANARSKSKWTALQRAAANGHLEACKCLVEVGGAAVNATEKNDTTPLHYAASFGHLDVCEYLVEKGADVNAKDKYVSPLGSAMGNEMLNTFTFLVNTRGIDINQRGQFRRTYLHEAASRGNLAMCEMLVKAGIDLHATQHEFYPSPTRTATALEMAIHLGHFSVAAYLENLMKPSAASSESPAAAAPNVKRSKTEGT